jgi:putative transposase
MKRNITTPSLPQSEIEASGRLFDNCFDPIESGLPDRAHEFLQAVLEAELDEALARSRYAGRAKLANDEAETRGVTGHRHSHRSRTLLGTFGKVEVAVPRARLNGSDGRTTEWKSQALRTYQRRTLTPDALIASAVLDDLIRRGLRRLEFLIVDGAPGLEAAIAAVWNVPVQRSRSTSTATCWRMRPIGCTRRSLPTTTT